MPATLHSSPCLRGERLAFTGILASMTHGQASELVSVHGGETMQHVGRSTTMLVIGEEGWPLEEDGAPSGKLQHAVELINQGVPLRLVKESEWLRLLGLEQRERDVHRLFTPAMLQQKLGIPVGVVRRWERLGLIKAVQQVHRLPYFDFQEVSGVRRLKELLQAGISRGRIEASLISLQALFPSLERPLARLELLARHEHILCRDGRSLVDLRNGQRVFDFEGGSRRELPSVSGGEMERLDGSSSDKPATIPLARWKIRGCGDHDSAFSGAENWFERGCDLLDMNEVDGAIEAFRMALMDTPDDPEIHFHLADALFRQGRIEASLERYHMAVEQDHDFIEAWTQLGCIRHQLGDLAGAEAAFDIALDAHPEYPDAIYHKAAALAARGRTQEAVQLWQKYLAFDNQGSWADAAREQIACAKSAGIDPMSQ